MSEPVVVERRDGVLVVRLNRPEARNAVDGALARALAAAMDELDADAGLRVGVLTGAGKGFCAGMDLKAYVRGEDVSGGDRGFAGICRRPPSKPLIAAIEGFALAGGLEVALSCDLLVAARGAQLGIPEARRGLIAAAGGLVRLPRRLPHHVVMEMALTGAPLTAERAWELGLVARLSEAGKALEDALALAGEIVANAPLAVQASKELVTATPDLSEDEAWRLQDEAGARILASADAHEGARAFAERRQPEWTGS